MFFHRTPGIAKLIYPSLLWRVQTEEKIIFLTFDDGPIQELTPWVLDQLNKFQVKATFFCVGENLNKNSAIAFRIQKEGHVLANHTHNHLKGWKTADAQYLKNVESCSKELSHFENTKPLFRPPYGKIKKSQIAKLRQDYAIVMWDVLTGDFSPNIKPERCLKKSINATRSGSIVVFHDNLKAEKNLKYALPRYIEHFLAQGYSFHTL